MLEHLDMELKLYAEVIGIGYSFSISRILPSLWSFLSKLKLYNHLVTILHKASIIL